MEPLLFQFVPIASWPQSTEEPGSVFFAAFPQIFISIDKMPPEPSFLKAEQSQISQTFLLWKMLTSLNHLHGPLLDSPVCLCLFWTGKSRTGRSTEEKNQLPWPADNTPNAGEYTHVHIHTHRSTHTCTSTNLLQNFHVEVSPNVKVLVSAAFLGFRIVQFQSTSEVLIALISRRSSCNHKYVICVFLSRAYNLPGKEWSLLT